MAAISIPCLVPRTNKAGVTSWYWQPSATLARAKWPPVPLGKDRAKAMQRAEEINAQVARWKAGGAPPSMLVSEAVSAASVSAPRGCGCGGPAGAPAAPAGACRGSGNRSAQQHSSSSTAVSTASSVPLSTTRCCGAGWMDGWMV